MSKKVGKKKTGGSIFDDPIPGSETKPAPAPEPESGGGTEKTRLERASAIATKVKGKSVDTKDFVKGHRNLIVYSALFLYNASVLIYAFVKYKDFPSSYEDYKKKSDSEKQEVDHAILKVSGFTLMSALALGGHMFINYGSVVFDKKDADKQFRLITKIIRFLSHACLGTTTSGIIFLIFRYYVDHTFAILVGVLIGVLLLYDLYDLKSL